MYRLKGSRVKRDAVLCILLFFCRWSWSFICISKGQFTTWKIQRIISYILAFSGTPRIPQIDCTWILDKVLKENEELTPPWKEGLCIRYVRMPCPWKMDKTWQNRLNLHGVKTLGPQQKDKVVKCLAEEPQATSSKITSSVCCIGLLPEATSSKKAPEKNTLVLVVAFPFRACSGARYNQEFQQHVLFEDLFRDHTILQGRNLLIIHSVHHLARHY